MQEMNVCIAPNNVQYLRIKSTEEINLENQIISNTIRNDKETIHNTYHLGALHSAEKHGELYYYWYELKQSNMTVDKNLDIRGDILRLEEMVVEAQYNIALLQLNSAEEV